MTDDDDLEAFFAAERANPARPGPALVQSVLADAGRERPAAPARPAARRLPRWLSDLGGWPAMAGLAAAAIAGVWIGAEMPLSALPLAGDGWDTEALSTGYADLSLTDG